MAGISFDDFKPSTPQPEAATPPAQGSISFDQFQSSAAPPVSSAPTGTVSGTAPVSDDNHNSVALDAEQENQLLGSAQFTTPDVHSHKKNYKGDATVSESGDIGWKDEKGTYNPTDVSKHVVLRDPADGKYKVYERGSDTDEGPIKGRILGLGRILGQGFATTAPGVATAGTGGEVAAAALRQGINVPKAIASPNDATATRAILAAKVPWGGNPLREAASQVGPALEAKTADTAAALSPTGEAISPADAGQTIREGLRDWRLSIPDKVGKAYDKVDDLVDKGTTVPLKNTKDAIFDITKKYVGANLDAKSKAVNEVLGPVAKEGGLNYDAIKFVRTRIGKMIENPGDLSGGVNEGELKQIYGGLTEDLRNVVQTAGGDKATSAWNRASKYTQLINDRRRSLDTVLGPEVKTDEGLFSKVQQLASTKASAGIKQLSQAKKALGEDWGNVASSVVSRLGTKVTKDGEIFDPAKFGKDYGSLSEEGRNVLFGSGKYRQTLDDIATISGKYPLAARLAHTGGHGAGNWGIIAGLEGAHEAINMVREGVGVGHFVAPAVALATALGTRGYAAALARPATARNMLRWMQSYEEVQGKAPTGLGMLPRSGDKWAAFNNASQALGNKIKSELELGEPGLISNTLKSFGPKHGK